MTEFEQGAVAISAPENQIKAAGLPLVHKFAAGLASLALVAGIQAESAPQADAAPRPAAADWVPLRPDNVKVRYQEKHCSPKHQVKLRLFESADANEDVDTFKVSVENCKKIGAKALKNIEVVNSDNDKVQKTWRLTSLVAGSKRAFTFTLPKENRSASDPYTENQRHVIDLKVSARGGKQLGHNQWTLHGSADQEDATTAQYGPDPEVVKQAQANCDPDSNFQIGVQDDPQSVFEQDITRNQFYNLASNIFGANLVRINFIYGMVQKYGMQPYVDAVHAARSHGYAVDATIMPTPAYMQNLDQTLGYKNLDPDTMKTFANSIATALGNDVAYYSLGNEVNHPTFNASTSMTKYKAMYLAGRAGLMAANPNAKVLAGELDGSDIRAWISFLNTLPNDGIAIHPYNDHINHIATYIREANTPLFLSEYGNKPGPDQESNNKAAMIIARCLGARDLIMYQLIHTPTSQKDSNSWDTGVIDAPPKQ